MARPKSILSVAERLAIYTRVDAVTGCHVWTASVNLDGYGKITVDNKTVGAHRVAYELAHGSIPVGLTIDHLCRNRMCVNPTHLEAVSMRENILRGEGISAKNARKTHCKRGHPLSGDNLYVEPMGRHCKACARMAEQARKAKRRETPINAKRQEAARKAAQVRWGEGRLWKIRRLEPAGPEAA